jgi:hypothetical protein
MLYLHAIFFDPWALAATAIVVIGIVVALTRRPRNPLARKNFISILWFACLGILSPWIMWQESLVISGGTVASKTQSVAVPIKGVTRYVTPELAARYDASFPFLMLCGISLALAYKIARVGDKG